MIFSNDKCCVCPRDVEIYLSAVFFCLAAALPHHNINVEVYIIVKAVKYIYKYIYKKHDKATLQIYKINEIIRYIIYCYISPAQAI